MTYPKCVLNDDVIVQGWTPEYLNLEPGKGCVLALGDPHNGYGQQVAT
jgi:hypothetical protein